VEKSDISRILIKDYISHQLASINHGRGTMVSVKLGFIAIVVGVLMLAFILLATPLHILGTGFGPKHIVGAAISALVIVIGIIVSLIPGKRRS
jgi:hypothetical protein